MQPMMSPNFLFRATEGCGLTCEATDFADTKAWWQFFK